MINLLPPQQKQRLAQEENERMIIIWGFMVAIFLVAITLTILFTAIKIKSLTDAQELVLEDMRKSLEISSVVELKKELVVANKFLSRTESFLSEDKRVSTIPDRIAGLLPRGVYITRLSYNDQLRNLTIEGFSPTRSDLLTFKNNLEGDKFFSRVEFLPANWIKSEDINFTANLIIDNGN